MIASTSRILILDAEPQRLRWIVGLLEQVSTAAHIVWSAESVDAAIELCRQRPDSILVSGDWSQTDIARLTEAIERLELATPIPILLIRQTTPGSRLPDWIVETFTDVLEQTTLTAEVLERSVRHAVHEVAMLHVLEQRRREIEQLKHQSTQAALEPCETEGSIPAVAREHASDGLEVRKTAADLATNPATANKHSFESQSTWEHVGGSHGLDGMVADRTLVGWHQTLPALPTTPPPLPVTPPPLPSDHPQDSSIVSAVVPSSSVIRTELDAAAAQRDSATPQPDRAQTDPNRAASADVGPAAARPASEADELARQLQTWVLPSGSPLVEGLDIAGLSRPALGTGGDFYDYVKLKDRRLGIIVGDATGSGFHAAALMMAARCYLRALSNEQHQPGALLERVNDLLVEDTRDVDFLTMFLLCVDPRSRTLVYAAAGQQSYIVRASGELQTLKSTSMPIGIRNETVIRSAGPLTLGAGDLLILPTDGVAKTQSSSGESYGVERIRDCVWKNRDLPARMMASLLQQDCRQFAGTSELVDDFTVVVVKRES